MQIKEVKITKLKKCESNQLSNTFFKNCNFCNKLVEIYPNNFKSCLKISGNKFYCPFCLRNNFNYKSNKNVLIYSFRAIIGYYYYKFYAVEDRSLWLGQIKSIIEDHSYIGLDNPVLSYDPETYLWFADFNKIGDHKKKAPIKEVKSTICSSFDVFEIERHVSQIDKNIFWNKFNKAFDLFYQKRQRPKDRKMLIPTLDHPNQIHYHELHEEARNFTQFKFLSI